MSDSSSMPKRPGGTSRRPTIRDVAADANVSKTSVSRYFGAERERLSPELKDRIEASVERLGFAPDRIAASLRGGRTRLIAALVADLRNPYSVAVIRAAEMACMDAGYSLMICNTDNDPATERRQLAALDGYSVEGLIVNTASGDASALSELSEQGLPIVLVDRRIPDLACDVIGLDDGQAVADCVDHLIGQGFTHLSLVSEPVAGISPRESRVAGFRAICRDRGIDHDWHELEADAPGAFDRLVAERLAEAPNTAILTANGVMTLAVCHAMNRAGPDAFARLGLLGIDELDWCALVGPGVSTLAQPVDAIGRHAVRALLGRLSGTLTAPAGEQRLPGRLIPRGSTKRG
ncbi:LacI family DNA-binding transcriptional regulator [Salinisphaera japonica]|uniref:LacI family DNA-binding transcriptional regulator n=1 Tax=Salinisphaera japonica TaxID=1304270 RepID=UPI001C86617F|nr:substrate-binding domain-containing protein [Salinisphaera japonica]